jgi:hypothetical protein
LNKRNFIQSAPYFFSLVFFMLFFSNRLKAQDKILLEPQMLYNFSTKGEAILLIDEQQLAGDPANGNGGQPETVFSAGWPDAAIYFPVRVAIDLGVEYQLSDLWFFDTNDADSLFIYIGNPAGWDLLHSFNLNTFNQWRSAPINTLSRFVLLEFKSPSTRISEIVLYGTATGSPEPPPVPVIQQASKMDVFLGVNGFVDDPIDKLRVAGSLREYHNWGWDEGNLDTTYPGFPNNQYAWNPSWVSGPGWGFNFDEFYQQLKSNNIFVSPDLQGSAPYITAFNDSLEQHKPLSPGENPEDPASYIEHADYMFQFAARYGKTTVDAGLLKLKPDQQPHTGLGLVEYLENWNEPDKWWFTRGGYFNCIEFAAMTSADADGHEGALGVGKGMKTADPNIRMVMGGLASLNLEYVRCMKLWSDYNRQTGFPVDVLNFHHYSGNGLHGISPEEDSLKFKLKKIVEYRNQYLPGKEIWLSEFGYDTNPESVQASRPIDTTDSYEVQGQWILRSYLEAAASGIQRAHMFMLRDVNALNPNIYNSSGLTGEIWYGHQPKKSWYYLFAMKNQLSGLRFQQEMPSSAPDVNVYRFQSDSGDTLVYAVWCKTSENLLIEDFHLEIGQNVIATMITPVFGDTLGLQQSLQLDNGIVRFTVSERPVFIRILPGNISQNVDLHGQLKIFNSAESALPESDNSSFCLRIFDDQNQPVTEKMCLPNGQNNFTFEGLEAGMPYKIRLWEQTNTGKLGGSWMWNNWRGVTSLDALIVNYMSVGHPVVESMQWIGPPPYSQLFRNVADVNNSGTLTSLDALITLYRSVGFSEVNPFPGGKHNFQLSASFVENSNELVWPQSPEMLFQSFGLYQADSDDESVFYELQLNGLAAGEKFLNIYFIVTGDVNISFEP